MMEAPGTGTTTMSTAFTVSIEAREGVTTGISAADRAKTIEVAIADQTTARDLVVPGHIFPLKAKKGGVLQRAGHTEGSVDLARLAGKKSAAVICEIMNDNGEMARLPDLEIFSQKFELPIVSIEDLITFRLMKDSLVEEVKQAPVETEFGTFNGIWYRSTVDQKTHFALTTGSNFSNSVVDVRVHKQRPISDVFGKGEDGGRSRINFGLKMLAENENAVFVYLNPSDTDHTETMLEKSETDQQFDSRLYGIGAQILRNLGVQKMNVYLSSERSIKGLGGFGLEITDTTILKPSL
jgi:3,4-dihydroxy 2-butanone 4-phosphate synthase/GTP cyclohydrolase II